jgi:subtilisin family serine protease
MTIIDPQLLELLRQYDTQDSRELTLAPRPIPVFVRHTGDVASLTAHGLIVTVEAGDVISGVIDIGALRVLSELDTVLEVHGHPPMRPHLSTSVPEIHADLVRTAATPYTGKGVIIGVLDTGIDIVHNNFRLPNGQSRVLSIWDQTLVAQGTEKPPSISPIGVEFGPTEIALALAGPDGAFRHQDYSGHGTNVAGIAAGNATQAGNCHGRGRFFGVAPDADLIIVKMQPDNPGPGDNFPASANQNTDTIGGFKYVLQQAARADINKPVVINFSAGTAMNPHDGTGFLDLSVDALLTGAPGQVIVVSAGNDGKPGVADDIANGDYSAGLHTRKHVAANGAVVIPIAVPPDISVPLNFDIWYTAGTGQLQFTLMPPTPPAIPMAPIPPPHIFLAVQVGGCTLSGLATAATATTKGELRCTLTPPANGRLPAGNWSVNLTETAGAALDLDLWIENNGPVLLFVDRSNATTVTSPGSAKNVITVAAYGSVDGLLAEFSGRGPTLAPDNRQKPEISAPGREAGPVDGIVAPRSRWRNNGPCCDCCIDFYTPQSGTSQAAPHVTGVVALMLQKNRNLTFDQIRATLQSFARAPSGSPPLPNNDWGFGKIDAQTAVANIPPGPLVSPAPAPALAPAPSSGSGGGAPTPPPEAPMPSFNAFTLAYRLRALFAQSRGDPSSQLAAALISTHFDEVLRLINGNRRVAAMWHLLGGPRTIRALLRGDARMTAEAGEARAAPALPGDLRRWFAMLQRYGSARLRADVERCGGSLLALCSFAPAQRQPFQR